MAETLLAGALRRFVLRSHRRLCDEHPLASLAPHRAVLARAWRSRPRSAALLEALAVLEAAIRERARVQARARRVLSDGAVKEA